jgi:hypothetical protein
MNWERFLAIDSVYWHGIGRICNRLLHVFLGCAPAVILTIFFCKFKNLPTVGRVTRKIIPYFITECKYA